MTKSKRCLFVLLNDKHYSAVSSVEDQDLNSVTLITSTATMQVGDDYLYNLTCAFMGADNVKQSINYTNITSGSNLLNLRDFVTKWYRKDPNYNLPGFYFINYKTDGLPKTEIPPI